MRARPLARVAVAACAAAGLWAAAGCKSQPGAVDLTIVADPSLSDATVANIRELDVAVGGAASANQSYLVDASFSSGRQERLLIRPSVSSGSLDITVTAKSAAGDALGYGQVSVTLKSGGPVSAQLTLTSDIPSSADGGTGGGGDGGTTVGPSLQLLAGHLGGIGYADGTGAAARFNLPRGSVLVAGNVYIADMNNHVIRQVSTTTGQVTTLAGAALQSGATDGTGPAARFYRPHGITSDGAGNLYVTDMRNCTIRKIVIASAAVTTLAGTAGSCGSTDGTGAAARFDHPHGITSDGTNLWVADTYNHTIRQIVIASGAVTTLAGTAGTRGMANGTGAAASFSSPHDVTFEKGNLYVADSLNNQIRQVTTAGVVTLVAGSSTGGGGNNDGTGTGARFSRPRGIVGDGTGNLYIADSDNNRVRKLVLASGAVTTVAGHDYGSNDGVGAGAGFESPMAVAFDPAGTLYALDGWGDTVRKVALADSTVTTVAGIAGANGYADGTGSAALLNRPHAVCIVGASAFVADKMNNVIRKVDLASGAVTTFAGSGATGNVDGTGPAARFNQPFGLASDGTKMLFVSDANNQTIRAVDLGTAAVTTLAGTAGSAGSTNGTGAAARFNNPAGLVFGGGTLYVADMGNQTIRQIDVASAAVTTLAGSPGASGSTDGTGAAARFNHPNGLALDGGALYVADQSNDTIRKIDVASAAVSTFAGTAGMRGTADGVATAARFAGPHALAADGMGNLYVADTLNHTIRKIAIASVTVTTWAGMPGIGAMVPGALPATLNTPSGLAIAADGTVVLATAHENAVAIIK